MLTTPRNLKIAALTILITIGGAQGTRLYAVTVPGGNYGNNAGDNGSLSREDLEKLGGAKNPASEKAQAQAKQQAAALAKELGLSCDIINAQQVLSGKSGLNGKQVDTSVYEVACRVGMGFLIESQETAKPVGMSCIAAEAARAADAARGKETKLICKLPENRDLKLLASTIMANAGTTCSVRDLRWFGKSATTQTEYSEVVCDDDKGYLLRTAMAGSQAPTQVMSCQDAANSGIRCKLTSASAVDAGPTLTTFKTALASNGISCPIDKIRVIGQEDIRKRYVIEYLCAGESTGTVAFVPLQGNTNKFESMDCTSAVIRHISCEFTSTSLPAAANPELRISSPH